MLAFVGFAMVLAIIYLLLKGKSNPIVVMIIVPIIAALLIGTNLTDIGEYVGLGMDTVMNNAILFIFSIIFFGVMSDLGVFDILVNGLIKVAGNSVIAITVATAIIGIIAHIDGATATTVLITVPAMYPVYKKMGLKTEVLLCLVAAAMGVMNLLPWGGPVARAATVLGMDATDLWLMLIPVQIFGIVVTIGLAVLLGMKEKKRLGALNNENTDSQTKRRFGQAAKNLAGGQLEVAVEGASMDVSDMNPTSNEEFSIAAETTAAEKTDKTGTASEKTADIEDDKQAEKHKKLLPLNALWTVFVIGVLVLDVLPSYLVFMLGLSVTLLINYPSLKEQNELIKKHAGSALIISATMLAAGVMVGVMDGTGMVEAMAAVLTGIIPNALGRFTHFIFGIVALPMGIMIGTDAYFFGFMPPILEVGAHFGVAPLNTAITMLIGKNLSLMISPLVPATFLALGLVDIDLKKHMKFSFKYLWTASIIMLIFALLVGIIQF